MRQDDMLGVSSLGRSRAMLGRLSPAERDTMRAFSKVAMVVFATMLIVGIVAAIAASPKAAQQDIDATSQLVG